ncbi:hypothetical protein H8356DRAFT_937509 [Neocallimastix lanati (nom. inval.)]|nr:hypothetical protein H8356DRAFT_937509 [Neocallimastix sp. JGI-2020a]
MYPISEFNSDANSNTDSNSNQLNQFNQDLQNHYPIPISNSHHDHFHHEMESDDYNVSPPKFSFKKQSNSHSLNTNQSIKKYFNNNNKPINKDRNICKIIDYIWDILYDQ